ncbi:MAG: type II toxin-antitoxin system HigB family toxin [bacterium]|nr:type II toxin-antitoxin system HigB family toxin [bacterium]
MRIIAKKRLLSYWKRELGAKAELEAWFAETKAAKWVSPAAVKSRYPTASILKSGRVVFNMCGNQCRLVVAINYTFQIVYIRFIGTHKEYDKIDAQSV